MLVFQISLSEQITENQMQNGAKLIKFYLNYVMKEMFITIKVNFI